MLRISPETQMPGMPSDMLEKHLENYFKLRGVGLQRDLLEALKEIAVILDSLVTYDPRYAATRLLWDRTIRAYLNVPPPEVQSIRR